MLWSLAALLSGASAGAAVGVGDAFPRIAVPGMVNLAGGEVPDVRGQVVLVDFWASWCAPCKASFPTMERLFREFAPKGFQVVAISVDEKPAAAAAFWKRLAPTFPALHDREQKLVAEVSVPTMPTSYLVDRAGRVRFVHQGFRGEATERELRAQIQELLRD